MPGTPLHYPPQPRAAPLPPVPRVPPVNLNPGDHGPDVASYQGYPDWPAVSAAGYRFGFSKVTEGTDYVNPFHARNWDAMSVFPVRGLYHFARPDQNTAQAEASYFIRNAVLTRDSDVPILDLEIGSGNLKQWAITWAKAVAQATGKKSLFYSGDWFMAPHGLEDKQVADEFMGLWYASYQQSIPPPPPGWEFLLFWQYTSTQAVPGILGVADCSIYSPTLSPV